MKIERLDKKVKCDMASCRNYASLTVDGGISISHNLNLCEDCAKELMVELQKFFVPKSPENFVKKATENKTFHDDKKSKNKGYSAK